MTYAEVTGGRNRYVKYYVAASAALITLIVYLPALRNEFVYWDDNFYIFENQHIRAFDAAFFRWAFFAFHTSNWHPLTWISHAIDYALWGLNPLGHHLTNIILHVTNTALVVLMALRLLEIAKEGTAQSSPTLFLSDRTILIAAGVTGLLFGIHPVHVESVAWVAERKDLLCALFFLLSIIAYVKYTRGQGSGVSGQESGAGNRESGVRSRKPADSGKVKAGPKKSFINNHYLLSLGFFVLALMSKPMAVTLPVVLLILDWHPLGRIRSFKTLWLASVEKIPFIALSLVSSMITIWAQRSGNALSSLDIVPVSTRLLVAARSLIAYLGKMLLPLNLIPLYPYPKEASLFSFGYVSAIALVLGTTIVCVVLVKKQKFWLSVWGYYVATLIPVLGIVQVGNQSMADRYTYLPSLGPFLIAGVSAAWIAEQVIWGKRWNIFIRLFSLSVVFVLVVSLSWLTVEQIAIWKNSVGLWTYIIDKEPDKVPLAYNNRGMVLYQAGRFDKAIEDFEKAIALDPQYAKAFYNRGSVFDKMGKLDKAIADYRMTISLDPRYYEAYYYLDQALKKMGQHDAGER